MEFLLAPWIIMLDNPRHKCCQARKVFFSNLCYNSSFWTQTNKQSKVKDALKLNKIFWLNKKPVWVWFTTAELLIEWVFRMHQFFKETLQFKDRFVIPKFFPQMFKAWHFLGISVQSLFLWIKGCKSGNQTKRMVMIPSIS